MTAAKEARAAAGGAAAASDDDEVRGRWQFFSTDLVSTCHVCKVYLQLHLILIPCLAPDPTAVHGIRG
jgi:hypothetical protein